MDRLPSPEQFRALMANAGFARTGWQELLPGFGLAIGKSCVARLAMAHDSELVSRILAQARTDVLQELELLFEERKRTGYGPLYDLLADYPFREGKGLRPAIVSPPAAHAADAPSRRCFRPPLWSYSIMRSWCMTMSRMAPNSVAARSR